MQCGITTCSFQLQNIHLELCRKSPLIVQCNAMKYNANVMQMHSKAV